MPSDLTDLSNSWQQFEEHFSRMIAFMGGGKEVLCFHISYDLLFRAEPAGFGRTPDLSRDEIVRTLRSIARERTLMAHA
jgi:hypothetical protein